MRKKLSVLIAIAISLSISTVSFAAEAVSGNKLVLTLDEALNKVKSSNQELKCIDDKINALNKQYDRDNQNKISIDASTKAESQYPNGEYVEVMRKRDVVPVQDQQNINDQKNIKEERFNSIKFDLEKQYMNVLTNKAKIDNINKNIVNLDEKIKQTQAKINAGQAIKDALNPLNAERSKRLSQLADPNAQMQKSLLNIKKYLNIDINSGLDLVFLKKEFVKFDDTDIESKIKGAGNKDYTVDSIHKNIDITKIQVEIYTKYSYDSVIGQLNSELSLQDLKNKLEDTVTNQQVYLWKAYYDLKNKEDAVQTQILNQKSTEMSYNRAKQSFNSGILDKVALDSEELAFNNQKVSTQQAVNEYMVTQEQFKYMLNGHNSLAASIK